MSTLYLLSIEKCENYNMDYFARYFPQRLEQAQRFRHGEDRLRSLSLAVLLHEVLGLEESQLTILPGGKPVAPAFNREFNISHSGGYGVLAVSNRQVGVDIEICSPRHIAVAKKVFTPEEQEWMQEDPALRFTQLWTMKEAVTKALGKGLALPLQSFSVLPIFKGEGISLSSALLYGQSLTIEGYSLSVCTLAQAEETRIIYL